MVGFENILFMLFVVVLFDYLERQREIDLFPDLLLQCPQQSELSWRPSREPRLGAWVAGPQAQEPPSAAPQGER